MKKRFVLTSFLRILELILHKCAENRHYIWCLSKMFFYVRSSLRLKLSSLTTYFHCSFINATCSSLFVCFYFSYRIKLNIHLDKSAFSCYCPIKASEWRRIIFHWINCYLDFVCYLFIPGVASFKHFVRLASVYYIHALMIIIYRWKQSIYYILQ